MPIETLADTSVPVTSVLSAAATNFIAEWKHAAYPAAKSCSGLVAPPGPPMATGTRTSTSSTPSSDALWPLRPSPVAVAVAV